MTRLFTAAAAVAAILSWCAGAAAQGVDPNFQSRLESIEPTPKPVIVAPKVKEVPIIKRIPAQTVQERQTRRRTPEEIKALLAQQGQPPDAAEKLEGPPLYTFAAKQGIKEFVTETKTRTIPARDVVVGHKQVAEPRKVEASLTMPMRYDYVSNAFATRDHHKNDFVLIAAPRLLVGIPVGEKDTLSLILAGTVLRYDEFEVLDRDVVTAQVGYTAFVSKGRVSWSPVASASQSIEGLTFTFTSQSGFAAGFEGNPVVLSTPAIGWGIEKIPVGPWLCGKTHCLHGGVGIEGAHTWADVPVLDNWAVTGSASLSVTLPNSWSWSNSVRVSGKHFDHFPGDREDVLVIAATGLSWSPNANVTLLTGLEYTRQFSSIQPLNWDGFRLQPQVRLRIVFD